MMEPKPCILVADDEMDVRKILFDSLTHWGAKVLVAADGDEALCLVAKQPIDIALLDVRMPGPSGMELATCLQKIDPDVCVIIITAFGTTEQAVDAIKDGAFYYLCKPCAPSRVREIVARAWQEHVAHTQIKVGDVIIDWQKQQVITEDSRQSLDDLSRRERQVLDILAEGYSNLEIAQRLEIRKCTASTHIRNILSKLQVKNRTQAAMLWERRKQQRTH